MMSRRLVYPPSSPLGISISGGTHRPFIPDELLFLAGRQCRSSKSPVVAPAPFASRCRRRSGDRDGGSSTAATAVTMARSVGIAHSWWRCLVRAGAGEEKISRCVFSTEKVD
uniref:Uncharacterized protein n=1 Tax=Triticum urartu TaxID=4572 RepID=A0A8R7Q2T9_TRIUA